MLMEPLDDRSHRLKFGRISHFFVQCVFRAIFKIKKNLLNIISRFVL